LRLVSAAGLVRCQCCDGASPVYEVVEAEVFARLHQQVLDLLGSAGAIDWSRASVDGTHVRAVKGGI
jgi:hypothetical protein